MSKCKICNKELYEKTSFVNLFTNNYTVHIECMNNIVINSDREAFPFEDKLIYYDYLFYDISPTYNFEYLESKYMNILFSRNLLISDWSIIIYYEEGLFDDFSESDLQILISLSNMAVLVISSIYYDLSRVFNENF